MAAARSGCGCRTLPPMSRTACGGPDISRRFSRRSPPTLALGIAAATSVFALTRVVLLQSLPYTASDALVHVAEIDTRRPSSGNASYLDFRDYRAQNSTLVDIAAFCGGSRIITGTGDPDRVPMVEVSDGFLGLLGVRPALGRDFDAADMERKTHLSSS